MSDGTASCFYMRQDDWSLSAKPYDLRERLLNFAVVVVRLVQFLHSQGPIARALSYQLLDSPNSAGANYEEADDGSSGRDQRAKRMIALRELKETRFRLLVLRRADILKDVHAPVIQESDELVRILATLIRKTPAE